MPKPEIVELHMAFMWDCPGCGSENFERSLAVEKEQLSESDREEIVEQFGFDSCDDLDDYLDSGQHLSQVPFSVKCKSCKQEFNTLHPDLPENGPGEEYGE